MSLIDDISGEQTEHLAVLYCDISQGDGAPSAESEVALWRVNYFRAAGEMAADFGGQEAITAAGGWIATFRSTVEALVCAQALSTLVGWQTGGPSLSGGLSAGEVVRERFGIAGPAVRDAIALCRRAQGRQVLVADPLRVVVAPDTARVFAPAALVAPTASAATAAATAAAASTTATTPAASGAGTTATAQPQVDGDGAPADSTQATARRRSRWTAVGRRTVGDTAHYVHSWDRTRHLDGDELASAPSLRLLVSDNNTLTNSSPAKPVDHHPDPARPPTPTPSPRVALRLNILGWVRLEAGEPPVTQVVARGSQARAVLSMLALRPGPVHKDELAELLWPKKLPDHWDGALRGVITKIRRFLEAGGLPARDVLVGDGGYYELRLPPGVSVDRDRATALIQTAETALAENRPEHASILARQAVTILARHLLSGPDNAWFDQVRSELARDQLTALELCAYAELATGGIERAKRAAGEALALDRYRESSYRLLMQAHAAAGSRGEALRTYEKCRRMLAEELGVGPAPQTQALYLHLLG